MTASAGKTLGIILLVLILLIIAWPIKVLLFAPVAALSGLFHTWPPVFDRIHLGPFHFIGFAGFSLFALALLFLWIAVIVWVYRDAESRGMSGVLWALIVFIGHLVGLLIYLIVRSDHPIAAPAANRVQVSACAKCGKTVGKDYTYCPHCGERMQSVCPKCGKPVDKSWQACPHCSEKL